MTKSKKGLRVLKLDLTKPLYEQIRGVLEPEEEVDVTLREHEDTREHAVREEILAALRAQFADRARYDALGDGPHGSRLFQGSVSLCMCGRCDTPPLGPVQFYLYPTPHGEHCWTDAVATDDRTYEHCGNGPFANEKECMIDATLHLGIHLKEDREAGNVSPYGPISPGGWHG